MKTNHYIMKWLMLFMAIHSHGIIYGQNTSEAESAQTFVESASGNLSEKDLVEFEPLQILYPDTTSTSTDPVGGTAGELNISDLGSAGYTIPVEVPRGINGMQPGISICYDSHAGNGPLGWGFRLSCQSAITFVAKDPFHDGTAKGLSYDWTDALALDGRRLVLKSGTHGTAGAVYTPEGDPYTNVTLKTEPTTEKPYFQVDAPDGLRYNYGVGKSLQTVTIDGTAHYVAWHLFKAYDRHNTSVIYSYAYDNNCAYLNSITYDDKTVAFLYETRTNDPQQFKIGSVSAALTKRLKTIQVRKTAGNEVFRTYTLSYNTTGDLSGKSYSRITSVTESNGAGESLRPVQVDWNYLPAFGFTAEEKEREEMKYLTLDEEGRHYAAADINGDGISDLIYIYLGKDKSALNPDRRHTFVYVFLSQVGDDGTVSYQNARKFITQACFSIDNVKGYINGMAQMDIDGDGLLDICLSNDETRGSGWNENLYTIITGQKILNSSGDTIHPQLMLDKYYSGNAAMFTSGDYDRDGKTEIFHVESGKTGSVYKGYYIYNTPGSLLNSQPFSVTLPSNPEHIFSGDFNNDGLTDVALFCETGYKVFLNRGTAHGTCPFDDSSSVIGTGINYRKRMVQGDFSGDGLPDFLLNGKDSKNYYLATCNGDGSFTLSDAFQLGIAEQDIDKDNHRICMIALDLDHDEKTDLLIGKAMYDRHGFIFKENRFTDTEFRWFRSTGTGFELMRKTKTGGENDAMPQYVMVGDFTGNGCDEIMNYGGDMWSDAQSIAAANVATEEESMEEEEDDFLEEIENLEAGEEEEEAAVMAASSNGTDLFHLYTPASVSPGAGKVSRITDGMGNRSVLTYAFLTNGGIYAKGYDADYPLNDLAVPLAVVAGCTQTDGAAGTVSRSFTYGGLRAHVAGKGLLGFTTHTQTDSAWGSVTSVETQETDTLVYEPLRILKTTSISGFTTTETTLFSKVNRHGNYSMSNYRTESTDIYGNTTLRMRDRNNDTGMTDYEEENFLPDLVQSVANSYSYQYVGGAYRLVSRLNIMRHDDCVDEAFETETTTTYNSYGEPVSVTGNANTSLPNTTTYTYDSYGNMLSKNEDAGSGLHLTTSYTYASNRNVASVTTVPATSTHTYTYDAWDRQLTHTESYGDTILTTASVYDAWGNLLSTTSSSGVKTRYYRGWGPTQDKKYYVLEWTEGHPFTKTWYDSRGRVVMTESVGNDRIKDSWETVYDSRGLVTGRKHILGALVAADTIGYDALGRVVSERHTGGQNTIYSYGNRSVIETTSGITMAKTFDAFGNIRQAEENGTAVTYTYGPSWKPRTVACGGSAVTLGYDDAGNRVSMTDPDTGASTWQYDNCGRVVKFTDARGRVTETAYDANGNRRTEKIDGILSRFYYDSTGRNLVKEIRSLYAKYLYYDKYQRLEMTKETSSGFNLTHHLSYDLYDRIAADSTEHAASVRYSYDKFGNMRSYTVNGKTAYRLGSFTGLREKAYALGDSIVTERSYDHAGRITCQTVNAPGSWYPFILRTDSTAYEYDPATSDLLRETHKGDYLIEISKHYQYDSLGRLVRKERRSAGGQLFSSSDMAYDGLGNMTYKTGTGDYTYGGPRPHAVTSVDNPEGNIPSASQSVSYNGMGKVSKIEEGGFTLSLYYGANRQRARTVLKDNLGNTVRTMRFHDGVDLVEKDGRKMIYQYLDCGLLYVKEKSAAQSAANLYYMSTDRLGSIRRVEAGDGVPVFDAQYEEWGEPYVSTDKIGFIRGYTGHEMLKEFNLVNMNGRLYDPQLARFLSPDPYVQMPLSAQGFNRYAYCMNNPTKYVDPSGEFFTWNLGKHGFSFGFNFTPLGIPLGFGINIGWTDGFSFGGYGEIGYRVGGSGFGSGISLSQSLDYNFSSGNWSTTTSENLYASYGVLNTGAEFSQLYNMKTGKWNTGWNVSTGMGIGNDELGFGLNVIYGSDKWSFGVGGYHNSNAWDSNPIYDSHSWNDDGETLLKNNCYSYALDDISNGNIWGLQPGGLSFSRDKIDLQYVMNAAISDGRVKKPSFWNKLGFGKKNYYSVYLTVKNGEDYHWYRQDKGGLWSHKPGITPVRNVDASNRLIRNPAKASRNYFRHSYKDGGIYLWIRRR